MDYSMIGIFNEISVKGADGNATKLGDDAGADNSSGGTDFTNLNDDSGASNPAPEPPAETGDNGSEGETDFTNLDDGANDDSSSDDNTDFTDLGDDGDAGDNGSNDTNPDDSGSADSSGDGDDVDFTDLGGDEGSEEGDGDDGDGEESNEAGEGDDGSGDEEGGDEEGSEEDELAKIEDELFSDLTDEQNKIKDKELKRLYMELYKSCDITINRINAIQKTDDNMRVLTFCAKKLIELRDTIDYILNETFWTKLYLDNLITYKTCLAQFNNVNNILKKLLPDENADIDDLEEDKPKELDEYDDDEDFGDADDELKDLDSGLQSED